MPQSTNGNSPVTYSGAGFAQRLLAAGMNVHNLRTHSTLRHEEWAAMDEVLVPAAVAPLRAAQDLIDRGLVRDLRSRGFGVLLDQWEDVSQMDRAAISMDADTATDEGKVEFSKHAVPLPLIHKGFRMSVRQLTASRQVGDPLDVTSGDAAARSIGEALEDMVINGAPVQIDGHTIHGYTTHPDRNTGNLAANWTDTGADPVADVLAMIQAAIDAKHYGPYWLYLPGNYSAAVEDDYKAESDRTLRQRLLAIDQVESVRVLHHLADHNVLLVQPTRNVVDLAIALDPQPFEWESKGGLALNFEMVQIAAPRIKADQAGNSGIVHFGPGS